MPMKTLAKIHQMPAQALTRIGAFLPTKEPVLSGGHVIPVCEPSVTNREIDYVKQAVSSSWLSSSGDFVERFEEQFATLVSKTKFSCAVNSGTSALHIALVALGIGPGDEVILPTFTMIATANAVLYCGATPVLVEADEKTWNIDVNRIEMAITKKTKAIIAVHAYGAAVDMDPILSLAKKYDLWIVEDAAEAHGTSYKKKPVGGIGDVGAFSLYANKLVTTGEGGIAVTNNKDIAKRLKLLHNHAFTKGRHFWHSMMGFGYRMTNMQAAIGLAQVERFSELLSVKRKNAKLYASVLCDIPGVTLPYEMKDTQHSYWMFGILIDKKTFGMDKNALRQYLAACGIETRSFFVPIHLQPVYYHRYTRARFPVAERLCRDGLYLPSSTKLTETDIAYVTESIKRAQKGKKKLS
jgi:perosamine synthetase